MPKKLQLEDLTVQSFVTSLDDEARRAVLGGGRGFILVTTIPIPVPDSLSCFHECETNEYITCACHRGEVGDEQQLG